MVEHRYSRAPQLAKRHSLQSIEIAERQDSGAPKWWSTEMAEHWGGARLHKAVTSAVVEDFDWNVKKIIF